MSVVLHSGPYVLKVDCDHDVRRAVLKGPPSYPVIDQAIQEIWPDHDATEAKYKDENGCEHILSEQVFAHFLSTIRHTSKCQILKLHLCPKSNAWECFEDAESTSDMNCPIADVAWIQRLEDPWARFHEMAECEDTHRTTTHSTSSISIGEKVDIIIAAFDRNGDSHLSFGESNALHQAAWGGTIPLQTWEVMCMECGENPELGLGRQTLLRFYGEDEVGVQAVCKDFEAAKCMLGGDAFEEKSICGLNPAWWRNVRDNPEQRQDRLRVTFSQASSMFGFLRKTVASHVAARRHFSHGGA